MRMGAVLEDVNPLPCSERQVPVIYWDGQAGIRQHGADVRCGVVGSFEVMGVPPVPFGDEALHEGFQISAGGWVPVFADDQRCAGVLQKEETHAFANTPIFELRADNSGDVLKPLAGC